MTNPTKVRADGICPDQLQQGIQPIDLAHSAEFGQPINSPIFGKSKAKPAKPEHDAFGQPIDCPVLGGCFLQPQWNQQLVSASCSQKSLDHLIVDQEASTTSTSEKSVADQ